MPTIRRAAAVVTAVLFTLGKGLIGLYIGRSGVASAFGAAASLVVLLVWVYWSAQIFLLGAEFTWVFAHRHGSMRGREPPTPPVPASPNELEEAREQADAQKAWEEAAQAAATAPARSSAGSSRAASSRSISATCPAGSSTAWSREKSPWQGTGAPAARTTSGPAA